jgi:outer membrane protein TolC
MRIKKPEKKAILWFFSAVLLLGSSSLSAQEAKQMNLKDVIQYSLQNHPSNAVYSNGIKVAKQQALEALSSYLPQVNGTGTFDDNLKRQITIIPAGVFSPVDIRVQFGNQYSTNVYGQLDQTIYDQSLINGLKANKPNTELAALRKKQNDDVLIYNTATAYYHVLIYQEQEKLLTENEKKLQEILNIQKLQYEKGVIKKVDYDRVRVSFNSIQSQKKLAQTNIDLALNELKNAMGMPMDAALSIADSLNFASDVPPVPSSTAYDVKNTWDYRIQTQNILLQQIDVSRKQASALPTLSGYARYGAQAFGNDFGKEFSNWYDYSVVGLRLNVPIFSGLRRYSQIQESELNLANARLNLSISSSNLQLQMMNSNTQLLSSYNTLNTNKENLDLAKDVLQTTTLQYQQGVASSSDLLNSDFSLKEAQADYINSLYNYLISTLDIQKSQGTLSQYINQL